MSDSDFIEHDFPEVAALLRRGPSDVADEAPSPDLWAAIEAEVEAPVVSLASRRRSRRPLVILTAIAAMLLVAVPTALAVRSSRSSRCPAESASLAGLGGFDGSGQAKLADGCDLEVDLSALPPLEGGYYEVWLLDLQDGKLRDLVPLGDVDATTGRYKVASVDLTKYNVVDISREPDDGNPAHSGDSVLRGKLQ